MLENTSPGGASAIHPPCRTDPEPEARVDRPSSGARGAGDSRDEAAVGPAERQAVIDALSEHFAGHRLSVEELERRLDRASRAESRDELQNLVGDLPGGIHPAPEGSPGEGDASDFREPAAPVRRPDRAPAPGPGEAPARGTEVSVWGGRTRTGRWTPPRRHRAVAVQGGIELDYREARLEAGVYDLRAVAVMGAVEVIVPPGLHVEVGGTAILGSFEHEGGQGAPGPDAPVIRIGGFALMGSVEVVVEEPGRPLTEGGSR